MRKLLTGTAIALMFTAAPALADSATSASGEVIPSPTSEDKAVSEPAMKSGDTSATVVDEGTKATTAGSNAIVGADGEPVAETDKKAGMADGSTVEEGKPATTAGSEVITDSNGDPVSSDDS